MFWYWMEANALLFCNIDEVCVIETVISLQLYMVKTLFKTYLDEFIEIKCNSDGNSTDIQPFECGYKDKYVL